MTKADRDKKIEIAKNKNKKAKTHKAFPVWHKEEVIDKETGELVDRYNVEMEERDANFHKIWLWHIAHVLDLLGSQKIKILSYILENTNSDNLFIGTQRAIAEKTETAKQTVTDTIHMLVGANIMKKQQSGVYLINPEVIFRGGTNKRMDILYRYHDTTKKTEPKKKAKPAPPKKGQPMPEEGKSFLEMGAAGKLGGDDDDDDGEEE